MYQVVAIVIFSGVQRPSSVRPDTARHRRARHLGVCALFVVTLLCAAACERSGARTSDGPPETTGGRPLPDAHSLDAADTGVPAGTKLTRTGSMNVRAAGTVIARKDVHGTIHVHADDVTIRDTRVTSGDYWPIWLDPGRRGLRVYDTEVVGSGSCQAGIGTHDYLAVRVDVHGCGDGAKAGPNTTISSSWFHDLLVTPGSHNDGIQVSYGSHIVIRGNRIAGPIGQTSAIKVGPDYGSPISDIVIVDNWLDGGAYALYLDARDAIVRGNRFGRSSTYGPAAITTTPKVWADNVWADTHEPVTP